MQMLLRLHSNPSRCANQRGLDMRRESRINSARSKQMSRQTIMGDKLVPIPQDNRPCRRAL